MGLLLGITCLDSFPSDVACLGMSYSSYGLTGCGNGIGSACILLSYGQAPYDRNMVWARQAASGCFRPLLVCAPCICKCGPAVQFVYIYLRSHVILHVHMPSVCYELTSSLLCWLLCSLNCSFPQLSSYVVCYGMKPITHCQGSSGAVSLCSCLWQVFLSSVPGDVDVGLITLAVYLPDCSVVAL